MLWGPQIIALIFYSIFVKINKKINLCSKGKKIKTNKKVSETFNHVFFFFYGSMLGFISKNKNHVDHYGGKLGNGL